MCIHITGFFFIDCTISCIEITCITKSQEYHFRSRKVGRNFFSGMHIHKDKEKKIVINNDEIFVQILCIFSFFSFLLCNMIMSFLYSK